MAINVTVRDDPRTLTLLTRIAVALETIATELKTDSIDPAAVAEQTARLKESSDALKTVVDAHTVPAS